MSELRCTVEGCTEDHTIYDEQTQRMLAEHGHVMAEQPTIPGAVTLANISPTLRPAKVVKG